jgi:hypothetical protein
VIHKLSIVIAALIVIVGLSVGIRWATAPRVPVCTTVHYQGINPATGTPQQWSRLECSR